jgi:hypothetical protein
MNNNQNSTKNTVYKYDVTADSNINYDIKNTQKQNINVKIVKPSIAGSKHEAALSRATRALKLINPFKGV